MSEPSNGTQAQINEIGRAVARIESKLDVHILQSDERELVAEHRLTSLEGSVGTRSWIGGLGMIGAYMLQVLGIGKGPG